MAFLDELHHTPTHKIPKAVLRADAVLKAGAVDLQPTAAGGRGKT